MNTVDVPWYWCGTNVAVRMSWAICGLGTMPTRQEYSLSLGCSADGQRYRWNARARCRSRAYPVMPSGTSSVCTPHRKCFRLCPSFRCPRHPACISVHDRAVRPRESETLGYQLLTVSSSRSRQFSTSAYTVILNMLVLIASLFIESIARGGTLAPGFSFSPCPSPPGIDKVSRTSSTLNR